MRSREIRATGVRVTELGFGAGGLGDLFAEVSDTDAQETLETAWAGGVSFFDTAPYYGAGLSEHRLGRFLRDRPRAQFTVSTKVGRVLHAPTDPENWQRDPLWTGGLPFEHTWDFSYDGVMRSHDDSLQRMGLNRTDLLVIHDLDSYHHRGPELDAQWTQLERSGWHALEELRSRGTVGALGAGINVVGTHGDLTGDISRFLETLDLDFFVLAGRYTLLDQSGFDEMARCERDGVNVIVGAVFNSGILGHGPSAKATFNYQAAPPDVLARAQRLADVCARHDVPLRAAAIQFPLAHPAVRSVLSGPVSPNEARDSLRAYHHPVPADLWQELRAEGLIVDDAPTPNNVTDNEIA